MSDTPNQNHEQAQNQDQSPGRDTERANRPVDTLRDGWLKAAIWRNEAERGAFFTTTLSRVYRDQAGQLHDTQNFRNDDLLRLGELTRKAHHRTNELAREEFMRKRSEPQPERTHSRDLTR